MAMMQNGNNKSNREEHWELAVNIKQKWETKEKHSLHEGYREKCPVMFKKNIHFPLMHNKLKPYDMVMHN